MTHMWKCKETYVFDIPSNHRLEDVYWKSAHISLERYLKWNVPRITNVRFAEKGLGVYVDVDIPKYPDERSYFTEDNSMKLLEMHMKYANMSLQELIQWSADMCEEFDEKIL